MISIKEWFNDFRFEANLIKMSIVESKKTSDQRLIFKCAGSFEINTPLVIWWYILRKDKRVNLYTTRLTLKSHDTK